MKTYYIQSGNSNSKLEVSELLRELARKADEIGKVRPSYMYLSKGVDENTYATIESEVYKLHKIDQAIQSDAIKLFNSDTTKRARGITNNIFRERTVNLLEFDTSENPEIDFSIFLRNVADEIDKFTNIAIQDIIYHETINEYGVIISIIRMYCNVVGLRK